jgi:hypothetical protein
MRGTNIMKQKRHFIETDIKAIRTSHAKIHKGLKDVATWQMNHEKEDSKRFQEIGDAIKALPSEETITSAIAISVQKTVNGKIDDVKTHLTEQDKNMELLSKKIKPFDGFRSYIVETAKIIMYVGGLALSVTAIIELLRLMHIIS